LVPDDINLLFIKRDKFRGDLPIGVTWDKKCNKYISHCRNHKNKKIRLDLHDTIEEAFNDYKIYKETIIKQVAEKYKDRIPNKLYNTMYNYKVEITD
jgi:hypothetical protein